MRLIDADALLAHQVEADRMGAMLVVGKGYILDAPTVDAVPASHGQWEWFEEQNGNPIDGYDSDWGWRCSSCKVVLDDSFDDPDQPPKFNFCQHCGVDMRGLCAERDAAVRDDTTTITRDICYDHGEMTNYGAESCDKCGAKQPDRYPHCPGCGRRIER